LTDQSVLKEKDMAPRTVNKGKKREQILRAGLKVIARQGVGNFKMIDVAERARMGKGTLYEYFRSKDELITGVFGLVMNNFELALADRVGEIRNPEDQIRTIISESCVFFSTRPDLLTVLFDLWAYGAPRQRGRRLMPEMDKFYRRFNQWLAGIIDSGASRGVFRKVESRIVAPTIIAILDGLMFQAALGLIELDSPEVRANISSTVLDGILS
jgi:AcrR family transcriptional regulator